MSRHTKKIGTRVIAYGFDPIPGGGYFYQVFDDAMVSEENDEGIVVNEGFALGIDKNKMLELMLEHGVSDERHKELVALDMPI